MILYQGVPVPRHNQNKGVYGVPRRDPNTDRMFLLFIHILLTYTHIPPFFKLFLH